MIVGTVNGQSLMLRKGVVAADTVDYLEAQFVFVGDAWDGLSTIKAIFKNDKTETAYVIPLTDGRIRKEDHLNLSEGLWEVHLVGSAYDGGELVERITTVQDYLRVLPCGAVDGEPLPKIPATDVERLEAALEQIRNSVGGGETVADVSWVELADSGGRSEFLLRVTYTDGTTNDIQIPTLDSQLKQIIHIGSTPPRMAQVRELWFNTTEKRLYICTDKQWPYDEPIFEPVVPEVNEDTDDDALSPGNAVMTTPQDLTEEQKTQARENIGAVGTDELTGAVAGALTEAKESGEFNGKDGQDGKDGKDGQDGKDYVLTAADKTEIAEQAAGLVDTALLAIIGEVSV
jgi:hypothetical protein